MPNVTMNPCKCIDCGGDQPHHSTDCTYMAETFGDPAPGSLVYSDTGVSYVPELKPGTFVVGHTAALDFGYNNQPESWDKGPLVINGSMEVVFSDPEVLKDMFSWDNAITSNAGLTKRQMDILRYPENHAADPLVAVSLITRGYMVIEKRWKWFGDKVVVLTRAGKKAQRALPPECYRSDPGPQEQAENDCPTCAAREGCIPFDKWHETH